MKTLGAWPVYPGHPCAIALCVLRKYPDIEEAFILDAHNIAAGLGDVDIPGAGGCVSQGLTLIRRVLDGEYTPEEGIARGVDWWRSRTLEGGDHRDQYDAGVAEAERIAPMLLAELKRLKERL